MKKNSLFTLLLLLFCATTIVAQNANEIIDKAASVYNNANGISATYTIRIHSAQNNATESFEGAINMKGDKFTFTTPDLITWYDGSTQWTYMPRSEEVNISNPEGEELQFTNPVILLNSYKKGFTAVYKGESTALNGKATYDVELTPKKKSDITKISLQIEKFTSLPAGITIQTKNGIKNTIHVSNIKTGVNQADSFFTFKESDYPDAEIIDLR
ncbi:outer membrane lipoprotein-sorting protein [Parabacteroides sp. PF5-5]|uniref:LolA family protein n=1 Tax=unclassified Parabacteroides TaxID=2649774 RepID=UPI00247701B9|nr:MULTISPECIES: LolA-like putative outer membrane lipoprotein chaperone [unclassified Parabacteroides]MDH6304135.1 outer membrane lipoprotein-sorting protein [Parabacteroides sp. PH5-39]MDH6315165.1 outer membrane lipoprotein-sorting protein [Parabacteroides sp. PF5-13]MDH6318810.1 outer membrane lipoprotein-sorting protein [Parabacteroides sp. PH5-13]MDH6322539.1 outer membrane lipoprotein-sorting protein [Parabacteroides sp. PH5-8]MDH6326309.1 outer membrane lipoprotein-sorting protein [Par